MDIRAENFVKFFYSSHLFHGTRQATGVLLPVLVMAGFFNEPMIGVALATGALCPAIIDQVGGTKRSRLNEMLGGIVLGQISGLITGLASPYPALLWLVVSAQVFFYSMLSVYGRRGGLIGFGCLLQMMLSMHTPMSVDEALTHTSYTAMGGVFYILYSTSISHLFKLREERQTLAAALYATASYVSTRADFYDTHKNLDDSYRRLIPQMIAMTEQHQSARDVVLRNLPRDNDASDQQRILLWNVFIDMIALLDTMVASQTDYATLRARFQDHDILLFMRDTLFKISRTLNRTAYSLARNKPVDYRNSVRAELRAMEYELLQLKQDGIQRTEPETYLLVVQIVRRLRNASRFVDRIADNLRGSRLEPVNSLKRDNTLRRFITPQAITLTPFKRNLNLNSSIFRYALRTTFVVTLVLLISTVVSLVYGHSAIVRAFTSHSYWIILTVLIIMRPGFALTRQRTIGRLVGTLAGCLITIALFNLTSNPFILIAIMIPAMVLGNAFVLTNYPLSSLLMTIYILIAFHFLSPGNLLIIGERALDTLAGCVLAFACGSILPWWEKQRIMPLAQEAIAAAHDYILAVQAYITSVHADPEQKVSTADNERYVQAQLSRKNMHTAFGAFADSFYRMMNEPKSKQIHIKELNTILVQTDAVASQIAAIAPVLAGLDKIPPNMQQTLTNVSDLLDKDAQAITEAPSQIETEGQYGSLVFPLKQMQQAALRIRQQATNIGLM